MFRSGVPPHIGQSPLPGSEAEASRVTIVSESTHAPANKSNPELRIFINLPVRSSALQAEVCNSLLYSFIYSLCFSRVALQNFRLKPELPNYLFDDWV